jgi:hypothetical protein
MDVSSLPRSASLLMTTTLALAYARASVEMNGD